MPGPFDVLVSREARAVVAQLSDRQDLLDFDRAIDSLLQDPTESNPRVARISHGYGYELNEFAIGWGRLTLIFDYAGQNTVEVLAVNVSQWRRRE